MSDLDFQLKVNLTLVNFINSFMNENNVSAIVMERALEKVLFQLKDQIIIESLEEFKIQQETVEKLKDLQQTTDDTFAETSKEEEEEE